MDVKEMRELLGETQQQFSQRYSIPTRSLQMWEKGTSKCPVYFLALLEKSVLEDKTAKLTEIKDGEIVQLMLNYSCNEQLTERLSLSDVM